jgi:hypothetical protein
MSWGFKIRSSGSVRPLNIGKYGITVAGLWLYEVEKFLN